MAEAIIGVQEVPKFVMTSAKASRRVDGAEATHWPISALNPSMILFNAGLAQHHVYQRASAVNRPVQIAPSAIDFDVGLIDVTTSGGPGCHPPGGGEDCRSATRKFRLPIPNRLIGEFDTAVKEHLQQIA